MGKLEEKEKEKMYKRGLNWVINRERKERMGDYMSNELW